MLDLVRLSPRRLFPPGGEDLYRQIGRLTDLSPGMEVLGVACGKGVALEFFVREYGVYATGVDEDSDLVASAEAHFRESGLSKDAAFQVAPPSDLPFRDETFDFVMGEVGLAATAAPEDAIRELVRVTRPGGRVVLVQLVWQAPVSDERKGVLSEHLGARPLMAVELRRILLDAGVGELHTEDWIDAGTAFRSKSRKPFPDFAELFKLNEKLGILRRARSRWGWKNGVWTVFQREVEVHRLLTKERILGLNLLLGTKAGPSVDGTTKRGEALDGDYQTSGLPLFGSEDEQEG
ncbi:MAG: class I SAM-dependent methyltransferase [Gemmatimonadetes bacterium]|nr:class I SAM-dependent methyltransferase [Gemmatimonadota bacterium]NNM05428.1 class I SAM-dependent methyltransferase [Gemmatimonadota bacterium]